MAALSAGPALARHLLAALAAATADPPGVTRASYGEGEQSAHDLVRAAGEAVGARPRVDAAGNLYLTRPGRDATLPALVIGSHLDSVPHGGNFDGAAGVVAGLAIIAELAARGITLARDLTVLATRAEEAVWFPVSYPGSLSALGRLPPAALAAKRSDTGRSLEDHMTAGGFDPAAVRAGQAQLDPAHVAAFLEIHIEQGPRLVRLGQPLGVVTAINGGFRYGRARCLGRYAHSGAEPRFSRQDAVLGFADLVAGLERAWDRLEAAGDQATLTFGRVESDPSQHGGSRVLGELGFSLDVRSEHGRVLDQVEAALRRLVRAIAQSRQVRFELGPRLDWAPARMDAGLISGLAEAARRCGLEAPAMSSGAGHDAAVFAEAGVPTVMLFLRNENGSHNPDERLDMADLDAAIGVALAFVVASGG